MQLFPWRFDLECNSSVIDSPATREDTKWYTVLHTKMYKQTMLCPVGATRNTS